ncbi:MAG: phospholipase [Chlamydiae bacterium CG10_big_fil_rev_8_21_14_0_10_42_34]|nr:MAG: phospholipase [Chlamydiae bacterium CG10_big_fil_rev_8_21_14_0_10_42_34]
MRQKRFINPHIKNLRRSLWDAVLWKLGYYDDLNPNIAPPDNFIYPASASTFDQAKPHAIWIGHSTYLIEVDGLTILTDPIWNDFCSPVPIQMLRRCSEPPISLADLPQIDIVLISHNHYDHLDAKTVSVLNCLHPQIEWIVPESLSPWFHKRNIHATTEISWWKTHTTKNCAITAVPTQHFSGRTLWDKNKTHWNGYVLEKAGKRVYFTGDTGYNPVDFKAIGEKFNHMDLSLIPIGVYVPNKFMQPVHINPFEAVQIHEEVNSRLSLGMHWKTFRLSEEHLDRPPYDLYLAMKEKQLPFESFLPVDIGTYVNF